MDRADGPWKWDIAGNRFVDYWMGHGALLCGHGFAQVVEAVARQLQKGLHLSALHELQVEWAEQVCRLVPSVERVRFTSSGSEATLLAMRVARAFTGRPAIMKLDGHFHGWHDEALAHFVDPAQAGLNPSVSANVVVESEFAIDVLVERLAERDVAGVILEPGGGASGGLPYDQETLRELRRATREHGTLLIFDEVVSGFRYSPGGAQQLCNVLPDLTVLAKILSGGLPGGAVAGGAEVMSVFGAGTEVQGRAIRVPHTGTFNGNPISAAAGVAMLDQVADGRRQTKAAESARRLADLVNRKAEDAGVDVRLFAQSSIFHILIGAIRAGAPISPSSAVIALHNAQPQLYSALRSALLLEGVDCHSVHGWVSTAHDQDVLEATADSFQRAFHRLAGTAGIDLNESSKARQMDMAIPEAAHD
ncbi:aspartate aminotransferase family protein [Streptomyces sp. NBC_00207]|uniref:aspartate aminotransferase family protein n=1 Tax=unclassified Streptomyces TaxID=2593676 RepID=UPI002883E624|nr:aminotransferase class III-fold pyridoxal phosphate-dependent enzyme [Streptomyces sp. DSM 41633]